MSNPVMETAIIGCVAGMNVVRKYQMRRYSDGIKATEKEDATLLTIADTESQAAIRCSVLSRIDNNVAFWGEEGGTKGFIGDGPLGIIVDPLDGTNAFVAGLMTSAVIVGVYDRPKRQLIGCIIGEPVSGRLWMATNENQTSMGTVHGTPEKCWVWEGNDQSNVFMDISHGFKSRGRQMLTDKSNAWLYGQLNGRYRILLPGSNGLMQALVANGSERMAGSITTAVGFPGDVCGALLVKQAGGALKAYARQDDGTLREADPMDPLNVDALVCANSQETLATLAAALEAAAKIG